MFTSRQLDTYENERNFILTFEFCGFRMINQDNFYASHNCGMEYELKSQQQQENSKKTATPPRATERSF